MLGLDVGSCSCSGGGTALLPAVSACERYSEEPYCFLLELETKSLLSSGNVVRCQGEAVVGSLV